MMRLLIFLLIIKHCRGEKSTTDVENLEIIENDRTNNSTFNGNNETNSKVETSSPAAGHNMSVTKRDIFYAGFQVKRVQQLAAAKQLLQIKDYSKQYKMVRILLEKLFQHSKFEKIIRTWIPNKKQVVPTFCNNYRLLNRVIGSGQNFPETDTDLDALAHVVENTAFFGDILLRIPDIAHKVLKGKKEWELIINWSVGFCNETGLFDKANEKLLDLVAQELELIPRDPAYVNPYKAETLIKEAQKNQNNEKKSNQKQKKKKGRSKKGPRLSRTDL